MSLFDDLAGITQYLTGGVIASAIIGGQPGLLGGSDGRDYDPVPVMGGEQAKIVEPQHTLARLRSAANCDRDRFPACRADQQVIGESSSHCLERGPGLARSRVTDQQNEPAGRQQLAQAVINIPGHIRRNMLPGRQPPPLPCRRDGRRCGLVHAQQHRVRDVADPRQAAVSQDQAPILGPDCLLITALQQPGVALLPHRAENHHHGSERGRHGHQGPRVPDMGSYQHSWGTRQQGQSSND